MLERLLGARADTAPTLTQQCAVAASRSLYCLALHRRKAACAFPRHVDEPKLLPPSRFELDYNSTYIPSLLRKPRSRQYRSYVQTTCRAACTAQIHTVEISELRTLTFLRARSRRISTQATSRPQASNDSHEILYICTRCFWIYDVVCASDCMHVVPSHGPAKHAPTAHSRLTQAATSAIHASRLGGIANCGVVHAAVCRARLSHRSLTRVVCLAILRTMAALLCATVSP